MVDFKGLVAGAVMLATGGAASAADQEKAELENAPQGDNIEMSAEGHESSALQAAKAAFAETGLGESADIIDEIGETAVENNPKVGNDGNTPSDTEKTNQVEEADLELEFKGIDISELPKHEGGEHAADDVEVGKVESKVEQDIAEIKANDPLGNVTSTSETPQTAEAALQAALGGETNQLEGITGGQDVDHSDVSKPNVEASEEVDTGMSR